MAADATNMVLGGATVVIGTDLGYIKAGGITMTPSLDILTADVEQLAVSPRAWYTGRGYEVSFILMEPTLDNIIIAWDLPTASAGTAPIVLDILPTADMEDSHQCTPRVIALTGIVPGGATVRTVTWHAAVVTTPAPLVFSRMQNTEAEITFMCLYDEGTGVQAVGEFSDA